MLFVVTSDGWRRHGVSDLDPEQSSESNSLTPEQRLEPTNTRLITTGIQTIHDMETLRACMAYENANQQRRQILHRIARRAREIRSEDE